MPVRRRAGKAKKPAVPVQAANLDTFRCPVCRHPFSNRTRCLQHLNQPHGRCHTSLQLAVVDGFESTEPEDDTDDDEPMDCADGDEPMDYADGDEPMGMDPFDDSNDTPMSPEPADSSEGPYKEYYEGAARTYGKGPTFMEAFNSDAYAEERKGNIHYPFACKEEWEVASFLATKSGMTQATIDEFLKLKLVQKMHLSFKTAKELRNRIEMLPSGPQWQAVEWPTHHPTKKPLIVYYRNPVDCLQALITNPLVQDFIHWTPFRLWETADKAMRIFTEWLSGDKAWDLQGQYREGATVLGTVITSDKTTLTSMTGNRCAHPFCLTTTVFDMDFRNKASNLAWVMFLLMPIPKFLEKNPEIRGVLANRVFHAILDFVLVPLKKVAEVGKLMRDPLGWQRFCHTPIVSDVVDTPESALIAGVAGKRSSVTTATYKEFGDDFRHPPRTAEHTLNQLKEIEKTVDPWDLPAYIKVAKEKGLNGVHRPWWRDYALADPSSFLTPEMLHHWLKMFFDHVVKWCIEALGGPEIDFRFSVLRPHTGMRHFKEGISKAKQMTGREHRDIQRYIIPVIAGAKGVSKEFVTSITGLNDFFYHGQAPSFKETALEMMNSCLQRFHDHKQAVLDARVRKGKHGPIDNWYIPKLEFLQSVVPSIRDNGAPLQWSADVTERSHITFVKEPAENTNNQNYEPQIVRYLDRKEKCRQFDLATAMATAGVTFDDLDEAGDDDDEEGCVDTDDPPLKLNSTSELLHKVQPVARLSGTKRTSIDYFEKSSSLLEGRVPNAPTPHRTFTSMDGRTAFHLSRDYVGRQLKLEDAATKFNLPDLGPALAAYYLRPHGKKIDIGGRRPPCLDASPFNTFDKIEFWNSVRIQSRSYHHDKILEPQTLNAAPPDPTGAWKFGRADVAIVNQDSDLQWKRSGMQGHVVCQVRMILRVASDHLPAGTNGFVAYVERFDVVPQAGENGVRGPFPEPSTGMYHLRRSYRSAGTPMGDIVPLDRLRVLAELVPCFDKEADSHLTRENSLDCWDDYWLSKWFNKEFFFALSLS